MRNAIIDAELQHFRIDHNHPALIGRKLIEQRQNHRIDRDRFTGSGGARNQQMRHFCQIGHHRLAADILAQRQWQAVAAITKGFGRKNFAQDHLFAHVIGQFYADDRPARYR